MPNDWIALGVIAQAHGVRGQVKLRSFTAPPEGIFTYKDLHLADGTPITLKREGILGDQFIISIPAITSRNEAETWRGREIGVAASALPVLSKTEFYHAELIGMQVVDAVGTPCGTVKQVTNYGGGDLLEIEANGDSEFYSFTEANFPRIDREKRIIEFHPPEILAAREAQ